MLITCMMYILLLYLIVLLSTNSWILRFFFWICFTYCINKIKRFWLINTGSSERYPPFVILPKWGPSFSLKNNSITPGVFNHNHWNTVQCLNCDVRPRNPKIPTGLWVMFAAYYKPHFEDTLTGLSGDVYGWKLSKADTIILFLMRI